MKIITPLCVDTEATAISRGYNPRIIQIAFGDQYQAAAKGGTESFYFHRQLFEKVDGRAVDERMHCIDAQPVNMVITHPHLRVVAEETTHLARAGLFKIHGAPPRRFMGVREIRTELAGVISRRAEVVVDNIEQHRQAKCCEQRRRSASDPSGPPYGSCTAKRATPS